MRCVARARRSPDTGAVARRDPRERARKGFVAGSPAATSSFLDVHTYAPAHEYPQLELLEGVLRQARPERRTRRLLETLFRRSGITTRFMAVPDFAQGADPVLYREPGVEPSTQDRMRLFAALAPLQALGAARPLVERHAVAERITHVVTSCCTGFVAPGWDLRVIDELGIPEGAGRVHVGYMGCHAAVNALRVAHAFALGNPEALVLVIANELSSLHFNFSDRIDNLLSCTIFADGAAAALIGGAAWRERARGQLGGFRSQRVPGTSALMGWRIGNVGFEMDLSPELPDAIERFVAERGVASERPGDERVQDLVHAGGKAILEAFAKGRGTGADGIRYSFEVLARNGNMSSGTILFILSRWLDDPHGLPSAEAYAFGPGVVAERFHLARTR